MQNRKMYICPVCELMLRPDQIPNHTKKCSGGRILAARQATAHSPVLSTSPGASLAQSYEEDPDATLAQMDGDDNRDATRYWGHHFRDNGSYGSYPVHDDFDDESEP